MNAIHLRPLAVLATIATALPAQIDRDQAAPVESLTLYQQSYGQLLGHMIQGFRPSNIEISQVDPIRFDGSMVKNQGAYDRDWTLYFDKTRTQLALALLQNNQRPVDVERYEVGGQERYAAIAFENTGAAQKTWNWFHDVQQGSVLTTVQNVGGRIIDLDPYYINGAWHYDVISIANSGSDYKAWWVYTNTSSAAVEAHMAQHGSRVYDYEDQSLFGGDAVVLVRDNVISKTLFGQSWHASWNQDEYFGGRLTDVERLGVSSRVVTIVNAQDPFERFGVASQGTHGPTVHTGWGTALTDTQINYTASNLWPWAPAALHIGFFQTDLALDLLGATGCSLYTLPTATLSMFSGPNGVASAQLDVPDDPTLHGQHLQTQFIAVDLGGNALNIQTSNGLQTTLRHW